MKIRAAIVDLSALPEWPYHVMESSRVHQAVDPFFFLRMSLGEALAPAAVRTIGLDAGLLVLVALDHG